MPTGLVLSLPLGLGVTTSTKLIELGELAVPGQLVYVDGRFYLS